MANVTADRVLETSTSEGTGNITLGGAVVGYRAFSDVCSNGDTCFYCIVAVDDSGAPSGEWETGIGTYNSGALARTTVHASSAGAKVAFSVGTKQVMLTATASQLNGYLTAETDPVFTAWDKSTGISITESQISDFGTYEPADSTILKEADIGTSVQAYDGDLAAIAALTGTGYAKRTADNTWALDTPSGSGGGMTLLGTIATTSGTIVSLSSLTPGDYKQYLIVLDRIAHDYSSNANLQIKYTSSAYTNITSGYSSVTSRGGHGFICTTTGQMTFSTGNNVVFQIRNQTDLTSLYFQMSAGNFTGGQILVYGVA